MIVRPCRARRADWPRAVTLLAALLVLSSVMPHVLAAQVIPRPIRPAPTPATAPAAAAGPVRARIVGSVWDSVSMRPLEGALVRIVRADNPATGRSATTSATGRFAFDTVGEGSWLATFIHPVLDSLRLEPGILRIDITETGEIRVPLSTPSPRTMITTSCRAVLSNDLGMIVGEVRRGDDDAPIVGASVFTEWPEWVLQRGRMATEMKRITVRTDSLGRYALCGVPANSGLRAYAWSGADTTGAIEVAVPEAGYALQDFAIGVVEHVALQADSLAPASAAPVTPAAEAPAPVTRPSPASATAAVPVARVVRRGKAIVRGYVRTIDGRPLANAIVRVLGSGTQVRSNTEGAFAIVDAGSGTQSVEARAIGYAPYRLAVRLRDGEATQVMLRLAVQRVQLDTVRVVAGKTLAPEVRAIERRMRSGVGTILDAQTVRERATIFVTDALRGMPGVTISQSGGNGQEVLLRRNAGADGSYCPANIQVDGIRMPPSASANATLDDYVKIADIAAIEVYARVSQVPPEFYSADNQCGVIVVWTRRGTQGVMPQKPKPAAP